MVSKEGRVLGRTMESLHHRGTDCPVKYILLNVYRHEEFLEQNKKLWEERFTSFPSTKVDYSIQLEKQTLVCMRNEINKTVQFEGLQCWYYV
jgi:hypothetical protein